MAELKTNKGEGMKKFLLGLLISLFLVSSSFASISNQTNKIFGSGNDVIKEFTFPFKIFNASELQVYLINPAGVATLQTLTSQYTVTISTSTEGGHIDFVTAPATGYQTFIKRVEPLTQSLVLASEGALPAKQIENQLDRAMMVNIQNSEAIARSIQLPITTLVSSLTFPDPVASDVIGWNSAGTALQNYTGLQGAIDASAASAATAASYASTATTQAGIATAQASSASGSAIAAAASAASVATRHLRFTIVDPLSAQVKSSVICLVPKLDVAITITNLEVTLDAITNEVVGDIKWADAFIGLAGATIINDFDTTSGVRSDSSITSGAVAVGKSIYLSFDTAPSSAIKIMNVDLTYHY